MLEKLSKNDKKIYSLLRNCIVYDKPLPTLREINTVSGHSSPRSAVLALERLEKAGLIKRQGRNIKLMSVGTNSNASISTVDLPLVGSVSAGSPMLAEENVEAVIPVTTEMARPGSRYFLLRIKGDSMNEASIRGTKIEGGSIVLVKQQSSAEIGEIIVALINDSATVKILDKKSGIVILRPKSNKKYEPIILTDNFMIQGVVVAVLPKDLY